MTPQKLQIENCCVASLAQFTLELVLLLCYNLNCTIVRICDALIAQRHYLMKPFEGFFITTVTCTDNWWKGMKGEN